MASNTSKRHRMRCNACRRRHRRMFGTDTSARYTLKRHPLAYKRESSTACPACGSLDVSSIEPIRARELAKQEPCGPSCPYPFKHRKDSMRFCPGHPLAGVDPTEDEQRDFEGCWNTPRTGWQ